MQKMSEKFKFYNKNIANYLIKTTKNERNAYLQVCLFRLYIFSPLGAVGIDKSCFAYVVDFLC